MPVRSFSATESSRLLFPGTHVDYKDSVTIAALVRPAANQNPSKEAPGAAGVFEALTSGGTLAGYGMWGKWGAESPSLHFEVDDGSVSDSSANIGVAAERWVLLTETRVTGGGRKPIIRSFDPLTGARAKAEGNKGTTRPLLETALLDLGGGGDGYYFTGAIAAAARWESALTDEQERELGVRLIDWLSLEPGFFVLLDQASVTEAVEDLSGNGGDQSGRTATSVVTEEPPIPYRAPGFVGRSSAAYASQTALSLTRPEGTKEGDLLVARVYLELTTADVASTGWALACPRASVGTEYQQSILYRFDDGTAGPWSFTWGGSSHGCEGDILAYRGVDPDAAIVASQQANASAKSIKCPSVTTIVDDSTIATLGVESVAQAAIQPAGQIERADDEPSGSGLHVADGTQPEEGVSGERTFTLGAAATSVGATLALAPLIEEEPPTPAVRLRVIERPPMRQYLLATVPGGRVERWGEDELDPATVIEGLEDSDSVPGGEKELSGSLPRKPGVDYSDMQTGTKIQLFGAGDVLLREYRLERAPRTSGDYLTMDPAAMGYQVLLTDKEEAREIFLDADQSGWGDPSAQRRDVLGENIALDASTTTGWQGSGETPPGINMDFRKIQTAVGKEDRGEAWYDATGIPIGALLYHFVRVFGGGGKEWTTTGALFDDDHTSAGAVVGTNHEASTNSSQFERINATDDGKLYARFTSSRLESVGAGELTDLHIWEMVKVLGRHGLTLRGAWPEFGLLASDIVAYALSRWAPSVHFTTGLYGTLKSSSFLIPHLVFKEFTTVQEMIVQALRFELLEWAVRGTTQGPTFFLNPRGEREGRKRWRARIKPAKFTETGQQMDQVWNRCVASFQSFDGRQHTVGPSGSGAEFIDARCEDTDPLNPINEAGEPRTKHLQLDGIVTPEGAAEICQRFLEKCKMLDGSGEATLTGFVEDEHGAEWPYHCAQSGDLIDFIDSSIRGYRYIVEATRTRSSRSVQIKIDAPPDSYEALLEQLGARDTAAGIGS